MDFLRAIKIQSITSFRGREYHVVRFYSMLQIPTVLKRY
jgi:hypothetical protein